MTRSATNLSYSVRFRVAAVALLILCRLPASAADDIQAILDKVEAFKEAPESAKADDTSSTNTTSVPQALQVTPKPSNGSPQTTAVRSPGDQKLKIWHPKDKLPRKIAGERLAGDFFVLGEYIDGGTVLYAIEDEGKGLIRQFVVVNRTSGLAPGNYYDQGHRPRVRFSREQPLIFVKKLFPGLYAVQVP